jgi:tryptophanyl-tRNA synthetase
MRSYRRASDPAVPLFKETSMRMSDETITVLTGDRPTGPLHLGHYAGSLAQRVEMQKGDGRIFIMVADSQAYTDNIGDTSKVSAAIPELVADYVACGLDVDRCTIFLQSAVPELAELTQLFMNLTSVTRLQRNPTIRDEIKKRGFGNSLPMGFLSYPVAQAADILGFRATHVPVGGDQLPMIELAVETASKINRLAGRAILPEPTVVLSRVERLPGVDGKAKASKSLGNAVFLSDSPAEVRRKVQMMFTDPDHLKVSDPGKVEGNVVFSYLDAFMTDREGFADMQAHYRRGGLGDGSVKKELVAVLEELLGPMRERRPDPVAGRDSCLQVLREGSIVARDVVAGVLSEVRAGLGILTL